MRIKDFKLLSLFLKRGERPTPDQPQDGWCQARFAFAKKYVQKQIVLDVGCGIGEGTYCLAKNGALCVTGLDHSNIAIEGAKKAYRGDNLKFTVGDAMNMDFEDESFDVIIALDMIEHIEEPKRLLAEVHRLLKTGGVFLLSTPNKLVSSPNKGKPPNPFHVKEYYPSELFALLEQYFRRVERFGLRLGDPGATAHLKKVQNTWRWRLSHKVTQIRLMKRVLLFIPPQLKQLFSGENKIRISPQSWEVSVSKIKSAFTLIAVCSK